MMTSPGFLIHRTQDKEIENTSGFLKVTKPSEGGSELSLGLLDFRASFLNGPHTLFKQGFLTQT